MIRALLIWLLVLVLFCPKLVLGLGIQLFWLLLLVLAKKFTRELIG